MLNFQHNPLAWQGIREAPNGIGGTEPLPRLAQTIENICCSSAPNIWMNRAKGEQSTQTSEPPAWIRKAWRFVEVQPSWGLHQRNRPDFEPSPPTSGKAAAALRAFVRGPRG